MWVQAAGWVGAILLATCALPQAYHSWRTRDFEGLSPWFLAWWGAGEVLTLIFVLSVAPELPLILNYAFNIFLISLIVLLFWREAKR